MTHTEIMQGIAAMQRIQAANPPSSERWQRASVALRKLGTLLNGGVAPKDAWGRESAKAEVTK